MKEKQFALKVYYERILDKNNEDNFYLVKFLDALFNNAYIYYCIDNNLDYGYLALQNFIEHNISLNSIKLLYLDYDMHKNKASFEFSLSITVRFKDNCDFFRSKSDCIHGKCKCADGVDNIINIQPKISLISFKRLEIYVKFKYYNLFDADNLYYSNKYKIINVPFAFNNSILNQSFYNILDIDKYEDTAIHLLDRMFNGNIRCGIIRYNLSLKEMMNFIETDDNCMIFSDIDNDTETDHRYKVVRMNYCTLIDINIANHTAVVRIDKDIVDSIKEYSLMPNVEYSIYTEKPCIRGFNFMKLEKKEESKDDDKES